MRESLRYDRHPDMHDNEGVIVTRDPKKHAQAMDYIYGKRLINAPREKSCAKAKK